jgi:hypothetical protein
VVAIIIGVVTVVLWWISRRQAITAMEEEQRRSAAAAREARIEQVTRSYIANNIQDANMSGALAAGVLSLQDWTEVRDFCERVDQRLRDIPVIPPVYRERLPDTALLEFFQRLQLIENWRWRPDLVEQLVNELRASSRSAVA